MKLKRKRAVVGYTFIAPSIIGVAVFYFIPYIISVYYSFTIKNNFVGFDNYISLFNNNTFWLAMKNTAVFSVFAIPLAIIIPFLIALFLSTFKKHTSIFSSLFLSPLIVPIASVIYVWQIIFSDYGIINGVLDSIGINNIHFFNDSWSMVLIVFIFVWKNCAYNIILFSAGIAKVPKEVREFARLDGASRGQIVRKIILPLISPTTFFVVLLTIISSFKIFREVYLLYGTYPDENVYMIQHFMNNSFYNLNYPRLSTTSIILSAIIIAMMFVFFIIEKKKNYLE